MTRAELFKPALAGSALSSRIITGRGARFEASSEGALVPASTLVLPKMIAREPVSRLIISAREWEDFSLDFNVNFKSNKTGHQFQKAGSAASFDARREFRRASINV